jgi:hypothetical protein
MDGDKWFRIDYNQNSVRFVIAKDELGALMQFNKEKSNDYQSSNRS